MKITRCSGEEVHFFDGDKYQVCPVCGKTPVENAGVASASVPVEQPKAEESAKNRGLFGFVRKKEKSVEQNNTSLENDEYKTELCVGNVEDVSIYGTVALNEVNDDQTAIDEDDSSIMLPPPTKEELDTTEISQMAPHVPPMPEPPAKTATSESVVNVAVNRAEYDSAKTVGVYADANTEPVVGWLICVKGDSFGESFNLKAGKNSIGRGAGMDVMLAMERSVSRDKHAVITYEPKKRNFFIQPGDSSGLVYLNDDLLMTFAQLSAYDTIQLGDALFKFVPFCGDKFVWEDYLEE